MSSSATEQSVAVVMPKMGISVSEGTVVEWRKRPGDWVEAEETVCDATTDKIDVEIPAPAAGRLAELLVEEGVTVEVGTPIARIDPASKPGEAHPDEDHSDQTNERAGEIDRSGFFSPVVRRMAEKHRVDLNKVEGRGVGGRIRKRDVLAYLESAPAERPLHSDSPYVPDEKPATPAVAPTANGTGASDSGRREPMSPMRRSIAEHMSRSLSTAAHVTTVAEVDFSAVAARRAELKEAMAGRGVRLTYLAFVAEATIEALQRFPVLNSSVEGEELVFHDEIHLGIAVSVDDGLVVPVIRNAERLSLEGLAKAIGDAADRARDSALLPGETSGGTFTITNPGQFGTLIATPVINQPQVAILDLEAIADRPVAIDGAIGIRPMAYLPLSFDHRALDGATAARFLGRIKQRLEMGEQR